MSYRALKRLLGESGLERKLRVMLGLGTALLVAVSFWIYARLTEDVAEDQLQQTGRTLLAAVVVRSHVQGEETQKSLDSYQKRLEKDSKDTWKNYIGKVLLANPIGTDTSAMDDDKRDLEKFLHTMPMEKEDFSTNRSERTATYLGAVYAEASCVACHRDETKLGKKAQPHLKENDLLAVVKIRISSEPIISGFHRNRALLLSFAFGTTILVSVGSFLIIRYVIVKPVKHLKEVADAISEGAMNVRSEIQTADEFEDLSHAFNRMLRNLIGMQDSNQTLISERESQLAQLARANLALYESNRVKTDFLHTMSHELRTPLNSIIGFSEVLLNAENLTEKQHRYAANIMTSGQQLMAQINDVLDLSKLEAGKMRVYPQPVDIVELIDHAVAQVRQIADRKMIEMVIAVPSDLPTVKQDAGKLRQILSNLLSNAVKFTPEGGKVMIVAAVAEGNLIVTVSDTGIGIAAEEQETIFEKFRQSANPLTREQGGTGLGLSIVRELANLLQGDVAVRSDLGRGSTFTVRVAAEYHGE